MYKLIDTHAHLEQIPDLGLALKQAKEIGVKSIVWVGSSYDSNKKLLELLAECNKILKVYPALGLHPGELENINLENAFCFLEENIDQAVAIGEIGLDYWYKQARKEGAPRELQRHVFHQQLDLAVKFNKPVILHSRGAWRECLRLSLECRLTKVLFHWYSGPDDILDELLEAGYYISASPACEYSKEHRRAIEKTPPERILLETDAPVRYRPKTGEYDSRPKDVLRTLKTVAKIKQLGIDEFSDVAWTNTIDFFRLS